MFKWNKVKVSSGEPTTPRVALANLPDADSWRGSPIPKISTAGKSLKHSLGRLTPDQRMETPHLIVIPSHRDKTHVSRPRTMSLLKHDEDVLTQPHKTSSTTPPYVTGTELQPQTRSTGPKYVPAVVNPLLVPAGSRRTSNPEHQMVPLKPALKGGSTRSQARQEFPHIAHECRTSSQKVSVSPPKPQYGSSAECFCLMFELSPLPAYSQHARSRGSSMGEGQKPDFPSTPLHQTPGKYVPAVIKEVAMKGEAIAVSWPLVDFSSRAGKGMPSLYFDVGFNPRKDEWAVRVERGGFWSPIRRDEADIPVSPHTILTEMKIYCIPPRNFPEYFTLWPIYLRRSGGLRCIDIFRGIFDTYNTALTEKEQTQIGAQYLKRCEPAFKQRCKDAPGLSLYNEECGMRRVDVLRGRRIFKAIVQDSTNTRWLLYFDDF
ncbi:hypothetical protein Ac2012v2_005948 [Leucoagaricus gongylophorus]